MPKSSMQSVKDIGQKLCCHRPGVMGLFAITMLVQAFFEELLRKDACWNPQRRVRT
jgi:hypothetical protein